MKNKLTLLALAVLFIISCGVSSGALAVDRKMMQTDTPLPTVIEKALATNKPLATPTATPTQEMVFIHGSYNLRAGPIGSGSACGHVSNELVTLIGTHENGWMKIQVGKLTGWVSPSAVEEKK